MVYWRGEWATTVPGGERNRAPFFCRELVCGQGAQEMNFAVMYQACLFSKPRQKQLCLVFSKRAAGILRPEPCAFWLLPVDRSGAARLRTREQRASIQAGVYLYLALF